VIFFLLVALVLYLVVPSGLVVGAVAALIIGAMSAAASVLAGGPVVFYGARLTASSGRARRWLGWLIVAGASVGGTAAAVIAVLMTVLAAGATSILPTFLPFV
jgi:hypothetical protein